MALGHGEYCDILDRAGVELRRADEVANVLEYREVEVGGAELTEPLLGHARVEVAHAAGV